MCHSRGMSMAVSGSHRLCRLVGREDSGKHRQPFKALEGSHEALYYMGDFAFDGIPATTSISATTMSALMGALSSYGRSDATTSRQPRCAARDASGMIRLRDR